ncbi:ImmA/IrrE family metallo-endopeptidase [Fulvivirga sp.]|uniref:ImmA/IrrE family metallo-endopeptidase n=1 Tax=Fulvivirga sp. TaxID=1931237 RepID=UPI0032EFF9CD
MLAEHLGVIVLSQFDVNLSVNDLDTLNGASDWSGAAFNCNEQPVILFNAQHSNARNESTIMHELSHIILGHKPTIDENSIHQGLLLRSYNEIHENEANWLGGCLQIPFDGLVTSLLNGKTIEEIAIQYGSSIDMVKYRVNKSGAKQKVYHIRNRH